MPLFRVHLPDPKDTNKLVVTPFDAEDDPSAMLSVLCAVQAHDPVMEVKTDDWCAGCRDYHRGNRRTVTYLIKKLTGAFPELVGSEPIRQPPDAEADDDEIEDDIAF